MLLTQESIGEVRTVPACRLRELAWLVKSEVGTVNHALLGYPLVHRKLGHRSPIRAL